MLDVTIPTIRMLVCYLYQKNLSKLVLYNKEYHKREDLLAAAAAHKQVAY